MKKYIKPEIMEEEVIVEDVIAASTQTLSFGDFFSNSGSTADDSWYK